MFTPHPGARTQPHRSIYHLEHDKENTTNRFPNKTPGRKPMMLGGGGGGGPSTIHGKASHLAGPSSSSFAPGTTGKQLQANVGEGKVAPKTVALERIGLSQANANANQATGKKQNGGLLGKGKGNEKDGAGGNDEIVPAPKLLFSKTPSTSTQTPFKQSTLRPPPTTLKKSTSFLPTQTPASKYSQAQIEALHTPLPSSTRRRKSRQSGSSSGRDSTGGGGSGSTSSTPMKQAQLGPQTPYHPSAGGSRVSLGPGPSDLLSPPSAINQSFVTPIRKSGFTSGSGGYDGFGFGSGQVSPLGHGNGHGDEDEQDPDASFGSSSGGASMNGGNGGIIRSASGLEGLVEVNEDGDEMMEMLDMGGERVGMEADMELEEDWEIEYMPPRGIPLPDLPPFHDEVTPLSEIIARFKGCPATFDFVDQTDPYAIAFGGWTMELLGVVDEEMILGGGGDWMDGDGKGGSGIQIKDEIELEDPRFRKFARMKQQRQKLERAEDQERSRQGQMNMAPDSPPAERGESHHHGDSHGDEKGSYQGRPTSIRTGADADASTDTIQSRKISLNRILPSSEIPLSPIATPPLGPKKALTGTMANKVRAVQNCRPSVRAGTSTGVSMGMGMGMGSTMRGKSTMVASGSREKVANPALRTIGTSGNAAAGATGARRIITATSKTTCPTKAPGTSSTGTTIKPSGTFPKATVPTPPSGHVTRIGGVGKIMSTDNIAKPTFVRSGTSTMAAGARTGLVASSNVKSRGTVAGAGQSTVAVRPTTMRPTMRAGSAIVKTASTTGPGRVARPIGPTSILAKKGSLISAQAKGEKQAEKEQGLDESKMHAEKKKQDEEAEEQMLGVDVDVEMDVGLGVGEGFGGFELTE